MSGAQNFPQDTGWNVGLSKGVSDGEFLAGTGTELAQVPVSMATPVNASAGMRREEDDYTSRFHNLYLGRSYPAYDLQPPLAEQPFQPFSPVPPTYPFVPQEAPYPGFGHFYPTAPDFPVDATQLSGFPVRQPAPHSTQPSPLHPSPVYPSHHSRPGTAQTQATYGMWNSPPMSPVVPPMSFSSMGNASGRGRGRHSRHASFVDEFGGMGGAGAGRGYFATTSSTWNSPASPFAFYTPYQAQLPTMDSNFAEGWTAATSPVLSPQPFGPRASWNGPSPLQPQINRLSWSGPSRAAEVIEQERERKAYHPQPPAKRSDWVMWIGNVPPNTSHEELWKYFNSTIPTGSDDPTPWKGPSSIFLISRSSCAFVNLSSQADLDRAVAFFNGKSLRPWDPRCPRMVCRVRRKDDDLRAGVGAQRGTGMHREWIKQNPLPASETVTPSAVTDVPPVTPSTASSSVPPSPAALEHPPDGDGRRRESIVEQAVERKHKSTTSHASTNSSFLARHFPKRIFILKSMTTAELEESAKTGVWRTQKHNEPILDQAFRTSPEVFLIFGANRSGEFFGYAKMIEAVDKERAAMRSVSHTSKITHGSGSSHSKPKSQPERISEEDDRTRLQSVPVSPEYLLSPSQARVATSSPGELTPAEEAQIPVNRGERHTDPSPPKLLPDGDSPASAPADVRARTLDPRSLNNPYFPPAPMASTLVDEGDANRQQALGGSGRKQEIGPDGVFRKDTLLTPEERKERGEERDDVVDPEGWGQPFKIQWIRVGSLPFSRTRHLRNPWNADREVKVSRDGTEVEPNVGTQLMAEWDKLDLSLPESTRSRMSPHQGYGEHRYPSVY